MIPRAVFTAVILFVIYALCKPLYPAGQSLNQWQGNLVKAQRFLYGNQDQAENIIIGSSLTERLNMGFLPEFYSLSFNGLSVFDGLTVIQRKEHPPAQVLIETNYILRQENEQFSSTINAEINYQIRKFIPVLREEYQPVVIISSGLSDLIEKKRGKGSEKAEIISEQNRPDLFAKLLAEQVAKNKKRPGCELLSRSFTKLRGQVNNLEKQGVTVIFYEMPVDARVNRLPKPRIVRDYFHYYFPDGKYQFVQPVDCNGFSTTDGVHLDDKSAISFTNYFLEQITK
jgi:hypothetical protein